MMKTKIVLLFTIVFMSAATWVYADDVIVFRNGNVIMGKVMEIGPTVVKYKRSEYMEGPMYVANKSELLSVRYDNGTQEVFTLDEVPVKKSVIPIGDELYDWNGDIDYLNMIAPYKLDDYNKLVILPFDYSKVRYPQESDNRYPALKNALAEFPEIVKSQVARRIKNIQVVLADEDVVLDEEKTLYLNLSIDYLDMGSRAARFWGGFGSGAQIFRIVVSMQNNQGYLWSFRHERQSTNARSYEICLTDEMKNFGSDIAYVMKTL